MQSHIQTLDIAELAVNQTAGSLKRLLTCEPLNLAELEISSLVLAPGDEFAAHATPHDQLYLLLSGIAEATVTTASGQAESQLFPMSEPGTVAYQPAGTIGSVKGMGEEPAHLLVVHLQGRGYKRRQKPVQTASTTVPSQAIAHHNPDPTQPDAEKILVFDAPTELIKRLYCFFLNFEPGEVVPVHYHDCHGVLLILLDGTIETEADGILGPTTIMYYRGGAPHGFNCVGDKRMLAFAIEFYRKQPMFAKLRSQLRETALGDAWRSAKAVLPGKRALS